MTTKSERAVLDAAVEWQRLRHDGWRHEYEHAADKLDAAVTRMQSAAPEQTLTVETHYYPRDKPKPLLLTPDADGQNPCPFCGQQICTTLHYCTKELDGFKGDV